MISLVWGGSAVHSTRSVRARLSQEGPNSAPQEGNQTVHDSARPCQQDHLSTTMSARPSQHDHVSKIISARPSQHGGGGKKTAWHLANAGDLKRYGARDFGGTFFDNPYRKRRIYNELNSLLHEPVYVYLMSNHPQSKNKSKNTQSRIHPLPPPPTQSRILLICPSQRILLKPLLKPTKTEKDLMHDVSNVCLIRTYQNDQIASLPNST